MLKELGREGIGIISYDNYDALSDWLGEIPGELSNEIRAVYLFIKNKSYIDEVLIRVFIGLIEHFEEEIIYTGGARDFPLSFDIFIIEEEYK